MTGRYTYETYSMLVEALTVLVSQGYANDHVVRMPYYDERIPLLTVVRGRWDEGAEDGRQLYINELCAKISWGLTKRGAKSQGADTEWMRNVLQGPAGPAMKSALVQCVRTMLHNNDDMPQLTRLLGRIPENDKAAIVGTAYLELNAERQGDKTSVTGVDGSKCRELVAKYVRQ